MTIEEMHYDFKQRFNKIDSAQNRNFIIPEIDRILNGAAKLFVQRIIRPKLPRPVGFTVRQGSKEDVAALLKVASYPEVVNNTVEIPSDFWHYAEASATLKKSGCKELPAKVYVVDYGEEFKEDPDITSSYEWQELNITFIGNSLKAHTDGTFSVKSLDLTYYKRLSYMHYAEGYSASGYRLPSGVLLTGKSDCELADSAHESIIDLAVSLATIYVNGPDIQLKNIKLQLGDIL